ncbi:hypothetical protein [Dolichospermum flos-aquae]|uniref:hypothetical protein n=1 Tax=Dolichospermum flosaquae TaxID=1166 RepID=UPI001B363FBD|nr:hypothetical protein [Dolichospermum flos-aquae]
MSKTENSLIITIPPGCLYNNYSFLFLFFSIIFYSVFGLIYWIIAFDYVGGSGLILLLSLLLLPLYVIPRLIIPVIKFLFSKPLSLFITSFLNSVSTTQIQIDQDYISIERWLLGWCIREIKIPKSDIISVGFNGMMGYKFSNLLILYIVRSYSSDENGENIQILKKKRHFRFGAFLTQQEKEWLVWEIKNTLN